MKHFNWHNWPGWVKLLITLAVLAACIACFLLLNDYIQQVPQPAPDNWFGTTA